MKEDSLYSIPWKKVNITAKRTVNIPPIIAAFLLPFIKAWWEYVIVDPLDNNITVLSKGNSKGLIGSIPKGGHCAPNSGVGLKALWKKAQKIAKKNKASDNINNITPTFIPLCTANEWSPKNVASLIISRNQKDIEAISKTKLEKKK